MHHIQYDYWVIRYPDTNGAVVARFDTNGGMIIPDSIAAYDSFVIESVADQEALINTTIDQTALTESERDQLSDIFPALGG
jgi:hypothetical protein